MNKFFFPSHKGQGPPHLTPYPSFPLPHFFAPTPTEVYPPHQPVSQPPPCSKAHIRDRHGHHDINVFYGQTAAVCECGRWAGAGGQAAFFASWPATTLPPAWRQALAAALVFMTAFRQLNKDTTSACRRRGALLERSVGSVRISSSRPPERQLDLGDNSWFTNPLMNYSPLQVRVSRRHDCMCHCCHRH